MTKGVPIPRSKYVVFTNLISTFMILPYVSGGILVFWVDRRSLAYAYFAKQGFSSKSH